MEFYNCRLSVQYYQWVNINKAMKRELMFIKDFRPVYGYDKQIDNLEDDDLTDLPSKPGVYIIVSFKTKFIYPIGQSKVIYIGKTDNIQRRLKEHQRNLINAINDRFNECWHLDRYNYMRYHGAKVYYYTCRGYQESKDLESSIIESFYDRYGSIPVANVARAFRCVKD